MKVYRIRYEREARTECDYLRSTYGDQFRKAFDEWLIDVARCARQGKPDRSIDLLDILERVMDGELETWLDALKRVRGKSIRQLLSAVVAVLRTRRPPWETRINTIALPALDSAVWIEISLVYDINHPEKMVVIRSAEGRSP